MKHKLSLLENAVDSLNEAIRFYRRGENGQLRNYKFSILLFTQSIELMLKFHVSKSHPLLIYKNPFSRRIKTGNEATITVWEALQFLENSENPVNAEIVTDLKWLKRLRNQIEHYEFDMQISDVRVTLSRLLLALQQMSDDLVGFQLADKIEQDVRSTFDLILSDHYRGLLKAQKTAASYSGEGELRNCVACKSELTAVFHEDSFRCYFCSKDQLYYLCQNCSSYAHEDLMVFLGSEHLFYGHHLSVLCGGCAYYVEPPLYHTS